MSGISNISGYGTDPYAAYKTTAQKSTDSTSTTNTAAAAQTDTYTPSAEAEALLKDYDKGVVYTKSAEGAAASEQTENVDADSTKTNTKDYSAIVQQMKADAEAQKNQLMDYVRQTLGQQMFGGQVGNGEDDIWSFLASGDFTIDEAAKAKAQEAISEDGYWGVEQTSQRIVDFAKALAGDDASKADELLSAFKKGYEQATKSWGRDLPDISKQTYDAVEKKFEAWKNGTETESAAASETEPAV